MLVKISCNEMCRYREWIKNLHFISAFLITGYLTVRSISYGYLKTEWPVNLALRPLPFRRSEGSLRFSCVYGWILF